MKQLVSNWLTEGLIDFEYKKYVLLAYFSEVKNGFNNKKLYPFLSDLVFHYQNLCTIRDNKQLLHNHFPERLTVADFEQLQLNYEKIVKDDELMDEIENTLEFAIPEFRKYLSEGRDIYESLEKGMHISPVGIAPLYANEGYLFISEKDHKETRVYEYQLSIFESHREKYRGIHTQYLETIRKSFVNTYEAIKIDLIKRHKKLPNPGTYLVESSVECPLDETFLPIAKRLLVKHVSGTGS